MTLLMTISWRFLIILVREKQNLHGAASWYGLHPWLPGCTVDDQHGRPLQLRTRASQQERSNHVTKHFLGPFARPVAIHALAYAALPDRVARLPVRPAHAHPHRGNHPCAPARPACSR